MKCLRKAGIDTNSWHVLALNRSEWRNLIFSLKIYYIYNFMRCDPHTLGMRPIPLAGMVYSHYLFFEDKV